MADTVESLTVEIEVLVKEYERIGKVINRKSTKRDKLIENQNKGSFGDFVWLLNNPNTPGQYEAMKKWIISEFGREFNGVQASGYYPAINQQAFSIQVIDSYSDDKKDNTETYTGNVKRFLLAYIGHMKPSENGFVSFTYATGQHSGIFDLAYKPDDETWWTTNTRYGRMVSQKQHASIDQAIANAQTIARSVDD